jgi:hypothetical protein
VNVERPEGDGGKIEGHAEQCPQNGFVRDHQVLRPICLQDLCNMRRTVSATWLTSQQVFLKIAAPSGQAYARDHKVLRPIRLQDLCSMFRPGSAQW